MDSFDAFVCQLVNNKIIKNNNNQPSEIKFTSPESEVLSFALKKEGLALLVKPFAMLICRQLD